MRNKRRGFKGMQWLGSLLAVSLLNFCVAEMVAAQATGDPKVGSEETVVERCLLITIDGLRWQEVFGGAEERLMDRSAGVEDPAGLSRKYGRENRVEARKALMPFFWTVIANEGQVWGNPSRESEVRVTNPMHFSYPGYNEILTGFSDPQIDSNDKVPNTNKTVLEWLNGQEGFRGRVAAFASWDVFPFIINVERSGVFVNAGWEPLPDLGVNSHSVHLNALALRLPHYWNSVRYDAFTLQGALDYLRLRKPKVMYVAFGETDDWAHSGRYDLYLDAATKTDAAIAELWNAVQEMEEYRGRTVMLITTDHGRGEGRDEWKNHSKSIQGCDRIWIAALGPGVAPLGERVGVRATQSQVAPTVARLLGLDFQGTDPRIAEPMDLRSEVPN